MPSTLRWNCDMVVTIKSNFIGNFKVGDNICFNLKILKTLYDCRLAGNAEQRSHLRKPIIVLNVSIIEAVLYDFHDRVKTFTREGVANLSATVIAYSRAPGRGHPTFRTKHFLSRQEAQL
jgi:hypothetical protein